MFGGTVEVVVVDGGCSVTVSVLEELIVSEL